jgi:hypothetical protein
MMHVMVPLALRAEEVARVVGKGVAAVVDDGLHGPHAAGHHGLPRRQARGAQAHREANGVDENGLDGVVVEGAKGVRHVQLVVQCMNVLWGRGGDRQKRWQRYKHSRTHTHTHTEGGEKGRLLWGGLFFCPQKRKKKDVKKAGKKEKKSYYKETCFRAEADA